MSSDDELDGLRDRALACRSEEEAFEIIERLRPIPSTGGAADGKAIHRRTAWLTLGL
jgi:hypothetical protein